MKHIGVIVSGFVAAALLVTGGVCGHRFPSRAHRRALDRMDGCPRGLSAWFTSTKPFPGFRHALTTTVES